MILRENESGKHQVTYAVACDVDDEATIGTLISLRAKIPNLAFRVGHRPVSMDALHNQLARDVPGDVYACFIDDALCLTKDWDDKINEVYAENPRGLWWWKSRQMKSPGERVEGARKKAEDEDFTLMPITSEAWRKAVGRIFPEHFPFWWGDTWLSEVYVLATERTLAFAPVEFLDCPKTTHNMRELKFWHDFYLWLQPERIAEAKEVAAKMGFLTSPITGALAQVVGMPNPEFVKRIDEHEAAQGDTSEPHEGYCIAKARAVAMMETGIRVPPSKVRLEDLLTPEVIAILKRDFPSVAA